MGRFDPEPGGKLDARQKAMLDKRTAEVAEHFKPAANNMDIQRIHAIDVKIRNMQFGISMWVDIAREEIADGTLENIAASVEEISIQTKYLKQRVNEIHKTKQYLLESDIPECRALYAIVEHGLPILEQYLETIVHIEAMVKQLDTDPSIAASKSTSEIYIQLSAALELTKQQFIQLDKIGFAIQNNAAYLAYRKYLADNRLESKRDEPVNTEMLMNFQAA